MNAIKLALRRPIRNLMLVVTLVGVAVLGCSNIPVGDLPSLSAPQSYSYRVDIGLRTEQVKRYILEQLESCFRKHEQEPHRKHQKIVLTSPKVMDVTVTQRFVCQIHSQRDINVCALEDGYLQGISVREGQAVKKGDLMFKIVPVLYQPRLDAQLAEARLAELEYNNTLKLFKDKAIVSWNEVLLFKAKVDKAKANADLAQAELNFTEVRAPFDGIVDRLHERKGSLIKEGEVLTSLSDNSLMWVYFNVPEAKYLEYMAGRKQDKDDERIELLLANGHKFKQSGKIGAIEAKFNNQTGNILFRADFPNPDGLLRHGQTGDVLIHRVLHDAIVIPLQATREILDKLYIYVVGEDHVVHQRQITLQYELEDILVLKSGLDVNDKIVLEGVRQVRDGQTVETEFRPPEVALANQKYHAE